MKNVQTSEGFKPMRLIPAPAEGSQSSTKITATCTLKGEVADEFEKLADEYGLNRSQLIVQMVYHCLGRSSELKDFYRRLQILGK